jgi:coenzyme F420-reducing hydrogenase alpha subunit
MVKGIEAAVAKLKEDPEHPVTAEVGGLIVEVRYKGRRTAADLLREIEPLDDESAAEMSRAIRESREEARKLEAALPR